MTDTYHHDAEAWRRHDEFVRNVERLHDRIREALTDCDVAHVAAEDKPVDCIECGDVLDNLFYIRHGRVLCWSCSIPRCTCKVQGDAAC